MGDEFEQPSRRFDLGPLDLDDPNSRYLGIAGEHPRSKANILEATRTRVRFLRARGEAGHSCGRRVAGEVLAYLPDRVCVTILREVLRPYTG